MIICTTPHAANRPVAKILGLVAGEVIFGGNFLRDWSADITDLTGGRVTTLERLYAQARTKVVAELREQAKTMHADAIIGLRFDYQVLGKENGIVMVAAQGTAVTVGLDAEALKQREAQERREQAGYYVEVQGKRQGPFSILQLSELAYEGKIQLETVATDEHGATHTVDDLMKTE